MNVFECEEACNDVIALSGDRECPREATCSCRCESLDAKGPSMADLDTLALPLLPLTTGVVLPGMVVTLTLESTEAKAAVDAAAGDVDRLLVLVPRLDGRYARVGTIAKIEDLGKIRGGTEALVIRGLTRATIGVGVAGTGEATWVQLEPVADEPASERAETLAREYRATVESIVEARGVPAVAEFLRGLSDPGQIADIAGYSPDLSFERKVEVLETRSEEHTSELQSHHDLVCRLLL